MASFRIEKDSLGELKIPNTADYGIHTARAVENFPNTGVLLNHYPETGAITRHGDGHFAPFRHVLIATFLANPLSTVSTLLKKLMPFADTMPDMSCVTAITVTSPQ